MWTFYDRFGRERQAAVTTHPVGSILAYGGSVAPPGWLICDGSELPKANYPELSTTLGSTYNNNGSTAIGDATNNFRLPDFRGHSPLGAGTPAAGTPGAGVTYTHGSKAGERLHALTVGEVPRHTHGATGLSTQGAGTGVSINGSGTGISINGAGTGISINAAGDHAHGWNGGGTNPFYAGFSDLVAAPPSQNINVVTAVTGGTTTTIQALYAFAGSPQGDRLRAQSTTATTGSHGHGVTDPGHGHGITDNGHGHGVTDPGHSHTVSGSTENGTAAGLGAGSPTHNNVGPVLATNFIIKF